MPTNTTCPSCNRALKVPDELLGKNVKCPTCGTTFLAGDATAPAEDEPPPPARRRAPLPDEYDDEAPAVPRRSRRREYLQPHRGGTIMVLGILSFFVAGLILGPIAWVMGNADLKEIRAGRMDPEGESQTNTGRVCGMISTILHLVGLVGCCVLGIVWVIFVSAAASNAH